jgi:hypothetical protein
MGYTRPDDYLTILSVVVEGSRRTKDVSDDGECSVYAVYMPQGE